MSNRNYTFTYGPADENTVQQLYSLYKENKDSLRLSVQTKPVLNEEQFKNLVSNKNVLVGIIKENGAIVGFSLFVSDLFLYPESHYALEYFQSFDFTTAYLNGSTKLLFAIGDRCGLVFSSDFRKKLSRNQESVTQCIGEYYHALRRFHGTRIALVVNFSQNANNQLRVKEPNFDPVKSITMQFKIETLDFETFVNIHWMENLMKRSRLQWTLNNVGKFFSQSYVGDEGNTIYVTKRILGKQYSIKKYSSVPQALAEKVYALYHDRLAGVNKQSPQKLEYSKETFFGYLQEPGIAKYLLYNEKGNLCGGYLLIGKDHSYLANWVTPSWRIADAYVKLIFVGRGEAKFAYLLLFAASSHDLLGTIGSSTDARILADWSEKINGRRFKNSLNITQVPFLPELISANKLKPEKVLARFLVKLANFKASLLDNDMYYLVKMDD